MVLGQDTLITLIVLLVIAVIVVIVLVYCCSCKPAWANTRRRLVNRQIAKDTAAMEQEKADYRSGMQETLTRNERERDDIRAKYQLKK